MRGVAGSYPLDRPTTFAVGVALGRWVSAHHKDAEVVIGMDTRESGPWIAEHVAGGLVHGFTVKCMVSSIERDPHGLAGLDAADLADDLAAVVVGGVA